MTQSVRLCIISSCVDCCVYGFSRFRSTGPPPPVELVTPVDAHPSEDETRTWKGTVMIKHLIIAVGILAVGSVASARDIRVTAGQIQGQAQGQQQNASTGNISNNYENFRQAPAFGAPGLAASDEACMGSSSGGAGVSAGAVGVSVTFGSTWESYNCNLRMFAQQLRLAGAPKAAIMILANHPEVKKALQEAGTLPADPVPAPTTPTVTAASTSDKHPACSPTSWATAETRKALGC